MSDLATSRALDLVRTSAWTRPTCTAGTNPTAWGNDSRSQNGELHAPSLNFGRTARQSTSVLISLGLPHAPSFLRAICSIPSVHNSEIRRERLFSRYQQKYQQIGRLGSDENKR